MKHVACRRLLASYRPPGAAIACAFALAGSLRLAICFGNDLPE
jgi:hypothetical protein